MSEQRNLEIVRGVYEAFGRGDLPAIINLMADDVDWYDPGPSAVTHAGHYHGRKGVEQFFARVADTLEIQTFEPAEFIAQGNRVVVIGKLHARVKQTGRSYDNEWAMAWTIRDGRIAAWQVYEDTARELAAHAQVAAAAG
jgi:uncharacterized protein